MLGRQVRSCVGGVTRAVRGRSAGAAAARPLSLVAPALRAAPAAYSVPVPSRWGVRAFSSKAETLEFQAETRKLLDIVTHSIYTDKEVFIRELISNASDALEKYRYNSNKGTVLASAMNTPPEINIEADPRTNTLTITDTGIGMTRTELVSNLGTIARSGSKSFVEDVKKSTADSTDGIIGQFGVGFYASFMVAERVSVESISAQTEGNQDNTAHRWASAGDGTFSIEEVPAPAEMPHGTRITLHLKEECANFADPEHLKSIIQRYSTFVSFPIKINSAAVNTVQAIWTNAPAAVTEEQHREFFQFLTHSHEPFRYKVHYKTDAPIDLKCLFYVPSSHSEKFGMGRMEPGVNLYSRKVLIEAKPKDLLPEWMRFIAGVVDSEDLPLSLSREKPQDSALLRRIRDVLVRKVLRFLADEQKAHPATYRDFYLEYHMFLKEGVCSDVKYMDLLSKLLLFESSTRAGGELLTLDEYIAACPPEQKDVYYLVAPSREAALASPYFEYFKKNKKEVLLLFNAIDEFVMGNLREYAGRKLVSIETSGIDLGEATAVAEDAAAADAAAATPAGAKLTEAEGIDMCSFLQQALGNKVRAVKITHRLSDSPAIVTDHQSGALRRMMRMVEQANAGQGVNAELPPQQLEINTAHPLVVGLFRARSQDPALAELVAAQLFDNALLTAGLVEDPRHMIPRLQQILLKSLGQQ